MVVAIAKEYQHVVWDWNGTLVDDVKLAVKSIQALMTEYGLDPISVDRYREIFGFPISDYYERLGFDPELHPLDELSTKFLKLYEQFMKKDSGLFPKTEQILQELGRERKQSVLSAASQWHLESWIESFGIKDHFDHIFGIDNINAGSKIDRGHELLQTSEVPPNKTLLIGDTDHDLDVGKSLGVDVLLIAEGHQSYERLNKIHDRVLATRFSAHTD